MTGYSPEYRFGYLLEQCLRSRAPLLETELQKWRREQHIRGELQRRNQLREKKKKKVQRVKKREVVVEEEEEEVEVSSGEEMLPFEEDGFFIDYTYDKSRKQETSAPVRNVKALMASLKGATDIEYMLKLIGLFRRADTARTFHFPVDTAVYSNYLSVITSPMDLSALERRVKQGAYQGLESFEDDVMLIFSNCMLFNPPGTELHYQAVELKQTCSELLHTAKRLYNAQEHQPFINPFHAITALQFPIDEEYVRRKVATSLQPQCGSNCLCSSLEHLGPYDLTLGQFESACVDRRSGMECDDQCGCGSSCRNRTIRDQAFDVQVEKKMVYGIEKATFDALFSLLDADASLEARRTFMEKTLLPALNRFVPDPKDQMRQTEHMRHVLYAMYEELDEGFEKQCVRRILEVVQRGQTYPVFSKGFGAILSSERTIERNEFITEYLGEVYPAWRFFEKQCLINAYSKLPGSHKTLGFYNMLLERHKTDARGYDVLFVDACRKGNFSSRCSHSCSPNATCVVLATQGRFTIAVMALKPIAPGEEITFNYHSVTDSVEEYNRASCFCGQTMCSGKYVSYVGEDAYQHVMQEKHRMCDRFALLVDACSSPPSDQDYTVLDAMSIKESVLEGLPAWAVKYAALVARFIQEEKRELPHIMMSLPGYIFTQDSAQIEATGIAESRIQSLCIALDKVKYVLSKQLDKVQETPLRRATAQETVDQLWNNAVAIRALVAKQLEERAPEVSVPSGLFDLIPTNDNNALLEDTLRQKLLALRQFLQSCSTKAVPLADAIADTLAAYSVTKAFYVPTQYPKVVSDPIDLSELGLDLPAGTPLPEGVEYGPMFILACVLQWNNQNIDRIESSLHETAKFELMLPSAASYVIQSQRQTYRASHRQLFRDAIIGRIGKARKSKLFKFNAMEASLLGTPYLDGLVLNIDSSQEALQHMM